MKKAAKLLAILLAATSADTVMAESGGWYAGIGTGQSDYENWGSKTAITTFMDDFGSRLGITDFQGNRGADSDDNSFANKLFGGYSFDDQLAVELSYINMGEVEAESLASGTFFDLVDNAIDGDLLATASAKVEAVTLDVYMNFPMTSVVDLIMKAGIYVADTKLELNASSTLSAETFNYSKTESSAGLHFAIGAGYKLTNAIGIRAEWEQLDQVEAKDGKTDVDLLSIALTYDFN